MKSIEYTLKHHVSLTWHRLHMNNFQGKICCSIARVISKFSIMAINMKEINILFNLFFKTQGHSQIHDFTSGFDAASVFVRLPMTCQSPLNKFRVKCRWGGKHEVRWVQSRVQCSKLDEPFSFAESPLIHASILEQWPFEPLETSTPEFCMYGPGRLVKVVELEA